MSSSAGLLGGDCSRTIPRTHNELRQHPTDIAPRSRDRALYVVVQQQKEFRLLVGEGDLVAPPEDTLHQPDGERLQFDDQIDCHSDEVGKRVRAWEEQDRFRMSHGLDGEIHRDGRLLLGKIDDTIGFEALASDD